MGHSACCTITGLSPVAAGPGSTLHYESVLRGGIVIPAFSVARQVRAMRRARVLL